MKGSIVLSLQEMVEKHHGEIHWQNILTKSGLEKGHLFFSHHDVDDQMVHNVLDNTTKELNITMTEAADAFGDYWVNTFAPKTYFAFFNTAKSAKDFLMQMNRVHEKITSNIKNATPPRFEYDDVDKNTLIMTYISTRGMEEIWVGLIKGAAKYFNETIDVERLSKNKVRIKFS